MEKEVFTTAVMNRIPDKITIWHEGRIWGIKLEFSEPYSEPHNIFIEDIHKIDSIVKSALKGSYTP